MNLQVDDNIVLKQLELIDAPDIFTAIDTQREHLGPFLPFVETTKQLSDTQAFVESVVNSPKERLEYIFTIRVNGRMAGLIGLKDIDRANKKTEIGYWLSRDFLRQGIMTRSVSTLCDFAFGELDINRIQIKCAVANTRSRNIPLRLGFHLEGIERAGELLTGGVFTDLAVYSKLKGEWPEELKGELKGEWPEELKGEMKGEWPEELKGERPAEPGACRYKPIIKIFSTTNAFLLAAPMGPSLRGREVSLFLNILGQVLWVHAGRIPFANRHGLGVAVKGQTRRNVNA